MVVAASDGRVGCKGIRSRGFAPRGLCKRVGPDRRLSSATRPSPESKANVYDWANRRKDGSAQGEVVAARLLARAFSLAVAADAKWAVVDDDVDEQGCGVALRTRPVLRCSWQSVAAQMKEKQGCVIAPPREP